jgi:hypothetical protein
MRVALALLVLIWGNGALAQNATASPAPETAAKNGDAAPEESPVPYWLEENEPNAIPGFPDNKTTLIGACLGPCMMYMSRMHGKAPSFWLSKAPTRPR